MRFKSLWTFEAQKGLPSTTTVMKTAKVQGIVVGVSGLTSMLNIVKEDTTRKSFFYHGSG